MGFVASFLTPLITSAAFVFLVIWFLVCIIWIFKKTGLYPNIIFIWKYKIRKKPFDDEIVKELMEIISNDIPDPLVKIKKELLLKGYTKLQVAEIEYLFKQINKQMKGGKHGE